MNIYLLLMCISVVLLQFVTLFTLNLQVASAQGDDDCHNESCRSSYSPLVNCSYLPEEFMKCKVPLFDHEGNDTAKRISGYGCVKWGGQKHSDVERSRTWCEVLDGIECNGQRRFISLKTYPCIKYNGHYFVTALIYSVLLGFLGMDRFCLGHTGTAVGKLLTLGGVGLWWIVDIILLVTGELRPADDSSWVPYY